MIREDLRADVLSLADGGMSEDHIALMLVFVDLIDSSRHAPRDVLRNCARRFINHQFNVRKFLAHNRGITGAPDPNG